MCIRDSYKTITRPLQYSTITFSCLIKCFDWERTQILELLSQESYLCSYLFLTSFLPTWENTTCYTITRPLQDHYSTVPLHFHVTKFQWKFFLLTQPKQAISATGDRFIAIIRQQRIRLLPDKRHSIESIHPFTCLFVTCLLLWSSLTTAEDNLVSPFSCVLRKLWYFTVCIVIHLLCVDGIITFAASWLDLMLDCSTLEGVISLKQCPGKRKIVNEWQKRPWWVRCCHSLRGYIDRVSYVSSTLCDYCRPQICAQQKLLCFPRLKTPLQVF